MKENLFVSDDCLLITCTFYLDRFLWISLDVKQWLQHAPLWAPVCWTDEGDEGFPVLTGGSLYPTDRYLLPRTKWMEEWWFHLNSPLKFLFCRLHLHIENFQQGQSSKHARYSLYYNSLLCYKKFHCMI